MSRFLEQCRAEERCAGALSQWRWPKGFVCPDCGHTEHCVLHTRALYQCNRCRHQISLAADTIFASTKLPLTVWFQALYFLTQQKNAVSALALKRNLGVSYPTARSLKHKLMQVMKETDDRTPLSGVVQVNDAYWGGEVHGGTPGRGSPNKGPFVAAVATNDSGHPLFMRMSKLEGFRKREIARWAEKHIDSDAIVASDGLACFSGIADTAREHHAVVTGGAPHSVTLEDYTWVNTLLGNVKNALCGTCHAINAKHLPRYLAEFCYRFGRRFDLAAMLPHLGRAAARTPPMPLQFLMLAEPHW